MIAASSYFAAFPPQQVFASAMVPAFAPMVAPAPVLPTPAASPQLATLSTATHHHLAHLASTVLASLHRLSDQPRRALRRRLHRLLVAAELHPACVMLALYFLRRASQLEDMTGATSTYVTAPPEQQFLVGLVLAQKFNEDAAYTNRTWSELVLDWWPASEETDLLRAVTAHLNSLERALLARLNWDMRVDGAEFATWCERLSRWASNGVAPQQQQPVLDVASACAVAFAPAAAALALHQPAMPRPWSPAYGTYSAAAAAASAQHLLPLHYPLVAHAPAAYGVSFLPQGLWAVPGA